MKQLVIIPMLPIKMRYSIWWNEVFPARLRDLLRGSMHVVTPYALGEAYTSFDDTAAFCQKQVDWELDWLCYLHNLKLSPSDVVLVLDCTTPGLIGSYITTHKPCQFMGFCHGTSFNRRDIFPTDRNLFDLSVLRAYDRILVASEYHRQKLLRVMDNHMCAAKYRVVNMHALPNMVAECKLTLPELKPFGERKHFCIVDRPSPQKRNMELILAVAKKALALGLTAQDIYGTTATWQEYLTAVAEYKFMLVTAQEETYGYQVHDAMSVGTIPIVPDDLSYPESVPKQFCYYRASLDGEIDLTAEAVVSRMKHLMEDEVHERFTGPIVPTNEPYVSSFFTRLAQQICALSRDGR